MPADVSTVLRALAVLVFAIGWIPIFRLRSEPLRERLAVAAASERRWITFTVIAVSAHVTLVELVLTLPAARAIPVWRLAAGIGVFAAGLLWWAWARWHLVPPGRRLDPHAAPTGLVVSGPFAVVRHPLALGMLVVALGPAVAAASWLGWTTFAAVALGLAQRCRQDEAELHAVFGAAYARYAARTWRLVPPVW